MDSGKKFRGPLLITGAVLYFLLLALSVFGVIYSQDKFVPTIMAVCLFLLLLVEIIIVLINRRSRRNDNNYLELAYRDPITGRDNYAKFKVDVESFFRQHPNGNFVVFYSDIRNFKYINDVYGFEVGNKVLRRYSDLLGAENKLAYARINADNFVSLEWYPKGGQDEMMDRCMGRVDRVSDVSKIIKGMPRILISVGMYCTNGDNAALTIDAMIDRARLAQRRLKNRQEAGGLLYSEEFRKEMLAEQEMENRMHIALKNGEFQVYLQPKFDLKTNRVAAAEALVRWKDPEQGLMPPMAFIPLFERNGFIQQLDTYMFEQVCILLRSWLDRGLDVLPVSVNVSKVQLQNPLFQQDYIQLKKQYQIPDGLVEIEFTESVLYSNSEKMAEVLSIFRANGFRSSIDDFGAGYSSLNVLKKLPADILKLDKLFFDEIEDRDREQVIIKNIISMAKDLSMQTVAEGVELWEQVEFLKSVQCEMVQGFVFDRPQPAADFEKKYLNK